MTSPKVGQRVAYSAKFIRTAGGYSKDIADMRGTIVEVKGKVGGSTLVKVAWEGDEEPTRGALTCHLSLAEKGSPVQDVDFTLVLLTKGIG